MPIDPPPIEPTAGGRVYFIGAGPGDPELLTLKAQRLISQAGVVIYAGSLVNPEVLRHAAPEAEIHNSAAMPLAWQVEVMATAVARGQLVARLHTGDPSVYGAILEQMRELDRAGIPYTVVPGVSSAFAAAAALGIEYTVPGPEGTQTVIFSRLSGRTPVPERESLARLAAHRSSLVLFLSAGMIGSVVTELAAAGYSPDTPVAVVFRASWPDELIIRGTLADIDQRLLQAEVTHQALIVVSPALRPEFKGEAASDSHLYGTAFAPVERQPRPALISLTRQGTETARRLHRQWPETILYAPARFIEAATPMPGLVPYTTSVRQVLHGAFQEHSALVCFMASGIVVRELAPLLRSKHTDPAVVVVDEAGQVAISLLAGHKGGANELARRVAGLLGGAAIVTTASDVQALPALDLLGREWGWTIGRAGALTAASAALVNGDPVGVVQEAGEESWWPEPAPANLVRYPSPAALAAAAPPAGLAITFRRPPPELLQAVPGLVVYHPPCLWLGLGCNRGTPAEEFLAAVDETLARAGLAPQSVAGAATIEAKANEAGLLAACRARGWPLRVFSRSEIATVTGLPNPSAWAERELGVAGVAEPAAWLAAHPAGLPPGPPRLLVEKQKFSNVTVAVALDRSEQASKMIEEE